MKLVGLAGAARSGKSTVGAYLMDQFDVYPIGFADALKAAAAILLNRTEEEVYGENGFDREAIMPEWGFSMRHFLQILGTEGMRNLFREDFWINRLTVEILGHDDVVITDVRYENEADFVRDTGGEIWHITRQDQNGLNEQAQAHDSESGVTVRGGDFFLFNHGNVEELQQKAGKLWTL